MAALSDGSVVLVGETDGDYAEDIAGLDDFVVVKLDADGVVDWTWQVNITTEFKRLGFGPKTSLSGPLILPIHPV